MAIQITLEELKGCKSYYGWIRSMICRKDDPEGEISDELCRMLFETDYIFDVAEDDIRARDGSDMRKIYAEEVGGANGKNDREQDRIWKSIHGKCSVLELMVSLCMQIDHMVNEEEERSMMPIFFRIMMHHLELDGRDDEDFDHHGDAVREFWKAKIERFMKREYLPDGSGGGLFPLKKWSERGLEDQRKVPVWYQMNAWIEENLDDDMHFLLPKWMEKDEKTPKNL